MTKDHMSEESYSGESEGEVEGAAKDLARTQSGGVEGEEKRKSGSGPAVGGGAKAMPKPQPVAAAGTKRGQSTLQGFFKKK